jgi:hypothetical protein
MQLSTVGKSSELREINAVDFRSISKRALIRQLLSCDMAVLRLQKRVAERKQYRPHDSAAKFAK